MRILRENEGVFETEEKVMRVESMIDKRESLRIPLEENENPLQELLESKYSTVNALHHFLRH